AGNIDHLAVGAALDEARVPPPLVIVVRTRQALGINRLREALRAGPARDQGGKSVAQGSLAGLPVELWLPPGGATAVIGTSLDKVPARPAEGLERLPAGIRSALEERLAGGTAAWAVAHSEAWDKSPLLPLLPGIGKFLGEGKLADLRTLAAWVPASLPLKAQAAIRARDGEAARRLGAEAAKLPGMKLDVTEAWLSLQRALE
ncbi:MAG: hypothetical protein K2W96_24805, partial [Gemmataceae bacterium]|nr:hypothetical protein [Gemmataceae bacterium]